MMKIVALDVRDRLILAHPVAMEPGPLSANLAQRESDRPLLLVFQSRLVEDGDADTDEADVERLRAEVRGLGMTLLILARDGSRRFESNDRYQCQREPYDALPGPFMPLFRKFAVDPASEGASAGLLAAFVVDSQLEIRFAFRTPPAGDASAGPLRRRGLLLRALVAASRSYAKIRLPRVSPSELTTRALVIGFEEALTASGIPRRQLPLDMPSLSARP